MVGIAGDVYWAVAATQARPVVLWYAVVVQCQRRGVQVEPVQVWRPSRSGEHALKRCLPCPGGAPPADPDTASFRAGLDLGA